MKKEKKLLRTKKGLREYSYLGCPLTRNRSAWCFRLCAPDAEGHGRCGRIAPHSLKSNLQAAIESHNKKQIERRLRDLEQAYLANPEFQMRDPGIRISEGEADIVLPLRDEDTGPSGAVLDAVCFKLMNDAATNAVGSVVESGTALTAEFSVTLAHAVASGDLIARGRYVGRTGSNFLADAILTDSDGTELGRGEGVFFAGTTSISSPSTDPATPVRE
jgi:acyl-coenzyme A thioesterase PaaI-like protein